MEKGELSLIYLLVSTILLFVASPDAVSADENQTNGTHLECVGRACFPVNNTVNGTNVDLCRTNLDCRNDTVTYVRANRTYQIDLTHTECINQACVVINGTGINQCTTNADCNATNMTYLACVNDACVPVPGNLTNQCARNEDCNQSNLTSGGGGSGSSGALPLAPPAQPEPAQPRTLIGFLLRFFGIR